jgi:hypothetical protein
VLAHHHQQQQLLLLLPRPLDTLHTLLAAPASWCNSSRP